MAMQHGNNNDIGTRRLVRKATRTPGNHNWHSYCFFNMQQKAA
jgi:hypothetical protein